MSNAARAQEAQEVVKTTMTVVIPQEEKKAESKKTKSTSRAQVIEEKKIFTIEEIKAKAEILSRLSAKYDDLQRKREKMINFTVSHEEETAEIIIKDAKGESFKSHSPRAISKFIDFCKAEFNESIRELEEHMQEIA